MDRIATSSSYQSALMGIWQAQSRQADAQARVSSGYKGDDLKAYAGVADTLTAMKTMQSRLAAFSDAVDRTSDRLAQQDEALNSVDSAAGGMTKAVMDAVASGDGSTMMSTLQGWYAQAVDGLNASFGGEYLFGGGKTQTPPVASDQMSNLALPISGMFANDQTKAQARLGDNITVTTGVLASDVATPMFTALQQIKAYNDNPATGPFGQPLTDAQSTFLAGVLPTLKSVNAGTTAQVAMNGVTQSRVDHAAALLSDRKTAIDGIVGKVAEADPAKAAVDLQLATTSLQASAQVFNVLQGSSLLNVLSTR